MIQTKIEDYEREMHEQIKHDVLLLKRLFLLVYEVDISDAGEASEAVSDQIVNLSTNSLNTYSEGLTKQQLASQR